MNFKPIFITVFCVVFVLVGIQMYVSNINVDNEKVEVVSNSGTQTRTTKLAEKFNITEDEFTGNIYVKHKSAPKNHETHAIYLTFQLKDKRATNPVLTIQRNKHNTFYFADAYFLFDNGAHRFRYSTYANNRYIEKHDDCRYNPTMTSWEWVDETDMEYVGELIELLTQCKTCKVKFTSYEKSQIWEIPSEMLQEIREEYQFFIENGGEFK